jgi:hypothetical protein
MTAYTKVNPVSDTAITVAQGEQIETQYDCAQQEFEEGGWQLKKSLEVDADIAYDLASRAASLKAGYFDVVRQKRMHFLDDFVGCSLDTFKWLASGVGTPAISNSQPNGVLEIAANNTARAITQNQRYQLCHPMGLVFETYIRLSAVTQIEALIGLYYDGTNYMRFSLDCGAGAAHWYADNSNGTANHADTGVDADTEWHYLTIRCAAGHIYFDIDGTNVVDATTNISTANMEIELSVTSTEAVEKTLNVDYVEFDQGR